ncbi:hypothetical protein COY16_04985 [Candidatus Roizmanbacteria bacterium CG_4_10_14_0_2_um_filter_39_13]|uniref:Uncharacterized protein n=1 Tax=Candidatus Roizmanbacteria bacterium CG_4_10_14_0_2_um_filter_39_13 TaxID=1974825 RepID=A0A2M7TWJ0_9BACT|nr:MAG: hypothetical protein COY16_04985 [Candidatus Roizmanbacteria bacterium CG_4_10_14_0_2_um_filter_39_13]
MKSTHYDKLKPSIDALRTITKHVAYLQYHKKDEMFRKRHAVPPKATKNKIDEWFEKLTGDVKKYEAYRKDLTNIFIELGCSDNEKDSIEMFLLYGDPIISSIDLSRIRINDPWQGIWIRVDEITDNAIKKEIEKVKFISPDAIIKDRQWTRPWDILRYFRIYKLIQKGSSYKKIANTLSEEIQKHPDSNRDDMVTLEKVKRVKRYYKKSLQ